MASRKIIDQKEVECRRGSSFLSSACMLTSANAGAQAIVQLSHAPGSR